MESENVKVVRRFLERTQEAQDWPGYEPLEFIDVPPDKVVVVTRMHTQPPNVIGFVFPIEDGTVGQWKTYPSRWEAMQATLEPPEQLHRRRASPPPA